MKTDRIELLKKREAATRAALAAERMKLVKREKREIEKLESLIGEAVVKAAALSPEFKLMITQTALCNVTDDKARRFLAGHQWL